MITDADLADVAAMLEGARLGNRPPLSHRQRETIAELAAYYKAAPPTVPETGDGPCITTPEVGTLETRTAGIVKRGCVNWDTAESPEGGT